MKPFDWRRPRLLYISLLIVLAATQLGYTMQDGDTKENIELEANLIKESPFGVEEDPEDLRPCPPSQKMKTKNGSDFAYHSLPDQESSCSCCDCARDCIVTSASVACDTCCCFCIACANRYIRCWIPWLR